MKSKLIAIVTIIQYVYTSWIMITAFEGIFMRFSNAGIEGNLMILFLYLLASLGNGLSVFIFGEPDIFVV